MNDIAKLSSGVLVNDEDLNKQDIESENREQSQNSGSWKKKTRMIPKIEDRVTVTQAEIDKAKTEFYEKEGHLRNNCFDFLEALPMCLPIDTSTLNFGRKKHVRKKAGVADLHSCYFGLFIAIETKIGDNGQSDAQKKYQKKVEATGGVYLLIYRLSDLVAGMHEIKEKFQKIEKRFT